jgi:2-polyprenyl-3-methyl-5-hydroxy-6-metoxy-1,4-benzoquinol methylase
MELSQKNKETSLVSPDDLMKIVTAFRQSRIILSGFELGVFTALGAQKKSSAAVARKLRLNARGLDRLMNALCALGLLKKKGTLFANSALSARHLVDGKPGYLGGLAHTANLWSRWTTLTRAVAHGGTVIRKQDRKGNEKKRVRGFIAAMHQRASIQAAATVGLLDLSAVKRTLDIGAGSGAYSIALARAKKDIRATAFDLPNVISLTRAYVNKAGLSRRFAFQAGDFFRDDFGSGFDLVFLSAIVHMNSIADNKWLVKKCARALAPGGQLVIQDFVMNEDRTKPAAGAYFAMNMLVSTEAGDTFTESEVRGWMLGAGLRKIRRADTPYESSLMIGKK